MLCLADSASALARTTRVMTVSDAWAFAAIHPKTMNSLNKEQMRIKGGNTNTLLNNNRVMILFSENTTVNFWLYLPSENIIFSQLAKWSSESQL